MKIKTKPKSRQNRSRRKYTLDSKDTSSTLPISEKLEQSKFLIKQEIRKQYAQISEEQEKQKKEEHEEEVVIEDVVEVKQLQRVQFIRRMPYTAKNIKPAINVGVKLLDFYQRPRASNIWQEQTLQQLNAFKKYQEENMLRTSITPQSSASRNIPNQKVVQTQSYQMRK